MMTAFGKTIRPCRLSSFMSRPAKGDKLHFSADAEKELGWVLALPKSCRSYKRKSSLLTYKTMEEI
jgi:hypothetical protein